MKHNHAILLLLLSFLVPTAFSQGTFTEMKNPAVFKQTFAEATKKTQTIQADFIQEKNLSVLSEKIITRGRFLFKKEKKLRWEYTEPFHYLIILNNGSMSIQDEERKSKTDVENNKVFAEINAIIMGCIQGNLFSDEKKFRSAFFESSGTYLVRLTPLAPNLKEYLSEIEIWFDKKDLTVARLEMHESKEDYTRIDFTGKKINASIPDDKFLLP
jgi:outer membrane lipoprotein-sorting protein